MGSKQGKATHSDQERTAADAEISANIQQRLAELNFGDELAAEGVTTVALDAQGNLVEHRPDGTTSVVATST
jgi:hypothetical protein